MLFKKITYQGIMNYGRKKLSKSKGTSTNNTARRHSRNSTMEKNKGQLEEEKCESKVYVGGFFYRRKAYTRSKATQILLCICCIPKQCKAEPNTEKLKP